MKKIRLDVELLDVESFDTTRAGDGAGGTVRGHSLPTDMNYDSCGISCWYHCFPTANPSCGCE